MFDRDALLSTIDLAGLADELLGPRRGLQRSPVWPCPSPSHAQTGRTPPVSVFAGRRGEQRWACHGCGAGGTAIDLVMAVQGVGVRDALETLAARSNGVALDVPCRAVKGVPVRAPEPAALAALDAYVKDCARRLWRPSGRAVREYLTEKRRLPADVLADNLVGADPGPGLQARPDGVPRRSGAVFPTMEGARAVYAQLRRLHPGPDQPRYLSLASRLAPNPGLARYRPSESVGGPLIVTEGPIDALAAAAAGFEAVALFGVGRAGADAARALARERRPVVLAFDADDAGRAATVRLGALLGELGCRSTSLYVPEAAGDLAGWLAASADWLATLRAAVRLAAVARDRGNEIAIG